MLLVRSIFWLGLAFVVLHPQDWDVAAQADALGQRAAEAGRQIAVRQIASVSCNTIECLGGKALVLASSTPNNPSLQASAMQDSPRLRPAPVPRPRPVWMG